MIHWTSLYRVVITGDLFKLVHLRTYPPPHPTGTDIQQYPLKHVRLTSGRYAFYWNAFLFHVVTIHCSRYQKAIRWEYPPSIKGLKETFKYIDRNFLKKFWRISFLIVRPLIPVFWTSGDFYTGIQSQGVFSGLYASSPVCDGFLRFISGATPADLLATSIVAEPFRFTYMKCLPFCYSR